MLTVMSGPDPPFDLWGYLGGYGLVLSGSCIILINYYVTGFMVIHQLVVISFNKILPRLKS